MIRKEAYNAVKNKQKRDEGEADLQLGQLLPDFYTYSNETASHYSTAGLSGGEDR